MRNKGNAIEGLLFDKEYSGRNRPSLALDVVYLYQQELLQLFWDREEHYLSRTNQSRRQKETGFLKTILKCWISQPWNSQHYF